MGDLLSYFEHCAHWAAETAIQSSLKLALLLVPMMYVFERKGGREGGRVKARGGVPVYICPLS